MIDNYRIGLSVNIIVNNSKWQVYKQLQNFKSYKKLINLNDLA